MTEKQLEELENLLRGKKKLDISGIIGTFHEIVLGMYYNTVEITYFNNNNNKTLYWIDHYDQDLFLKFTIDKIIKEDEIFNTSFLKYIETL